MRRLKSRCVYIRRASPAGTPFTLASTLSKTSAYSAKKRLVTFSTSNAPAHAEIHASELTSGLGHSNAGKLNSQAVRAGTSGPQPKEASGAVLVEPSGALK